MWRWMIREGHKPSSSGAAAAAWNLTVTRNMGGGPRTFPGGVSKWKWKRMHEKRASDKQKRLLEQEKQLYQARIRSHIRSTLSPSTNSSSSATHQPISPHLHIKSLADRFMKAGALDLWNHLDGPLTPTQDQAQAQYLAQSPSVNSRKLISQPSNPNLANYSQTRDYSSVPEVRNFVDKPRVSTEKRRVWRKSGSSTESESENEVEESHSKIGSIASLGKYDVKRERRVMPKTYNEDTDFKEQVELIKYQINKRKLSNNEDPDGEEQQNIMTQTRYYLFAVLCNRIGFFFVLEID